MRRRAGAPAEPIKFLGHGPCDNLSRSVTLPHFTNAAAEIASHARAMLRGLQIPVDQLRGVGISMSKLDNSALSTAARPAIGARKRSCWKIGGPTPQPKHSALSDSGNVL